MCVLDIWVAESGVGAVACFFGGVGVGFSDMMESRVGVENILPTPQLWLYGKEIE